MDLGQDHVGILGPHETGWDLIVVFEVGEDGGDEFLDALEGAAADAPLGDVAKPTLNHVEPGAAGGDEVQVEAWMPLQPALHRRALVRAVVVDDERCRASSDGVSRSMRARKRMNSRLRWRGRHSPMTLPSSRLRAANSVVVPWRV